jgi:hypothetical protein
LPNNFRLNLHLEGQFLIKKPFTPPQRQNRHLSNTTTVEQSDFQASIVAKCDIYGHRFAEHAKTALISAYNGDYTHSSDALADAAKACRQDDKSGSSGYRDYRAPPPMPSRARNNDRTFISSQSHKLPPP